jgi:lipoprotein-anchoring transpeptidase ErfK/SrfK
MRKTTPILAIVAALASQARPGDVHAQEPFVDQSDGVVFSARKLERDVSAGASLVGGADRYIVVHLTENRVFLFDGGRAIWSAPAATGKDFELQAGQHRWNFSTPRGLMRGLRMEKDPIWEAPDWHFIEKGLPVPPANSPSRRIRGGMGTTALYLGDGIAIHGTGSPQLVLNPDPEARKVSHGCIRLTNEAARELMHMVDVGTPVLIF